jgi:hypothetical protein
VFIDPGNLYLDGCDCWLSSHNYCEDEQTSSPTWGTTSIRNCSPLPQVSSKGYHIGRAVTHPGLPGVLRCFKTALLYPRSHPRDVLSGGLLPIQAYLGYYVTSKLGFFTPGLIQWISYREGQGVFGDGQFYLRLRSW